jgi:hypothetical protein
MSDKEWLLDEKSLEKRNQRLLKRIVNEEIEKCVALEKEKRRVAICKAIERKGNKYVVCGKKSCGKYEHFNCCNAILRGGKRKGEVCNVVNCLIEAHKKPKATKIVHNKWNLFIHDHWNDVDGDFFTKIRKLSCLYNE